MMYVAHRKKFPLFVWEPGFSVLFAGCLHASQRFSYLRPVLDSANNLVSLNKMQEAKDKDNVRTVPDGNQAFELQRQTYNKLNQDVFLNRYVTDQSSTHFVKNCSTSWCFSKRCQLQGTSRQVSLVTWSALQAILKKTSSELCCYRAVTKDRGNEDLD